MTVGKACSVVIALGTSNHPATIITSTVATSSTNKCKWSGTNKKEAGTEIESWKMALTPVVELNTITSEWKPTGTGFNAKKRLEERKERSVNGLMDSNETKIANNEDSSRQRKELQRRKGKREAWERWSMYYWQIT
jgi:hypothetical protein